MRVLSVVLVLLATLVAVRADDAAWRACLATPTRACMFDEAWREALARPDPTQRARMAGEVLQAYARADAQAALRMMGAADALAATLKGEERSLLEIGVVTLLAKAAKFDEAKARLARLGDAFIAYPLKNELAQEIARAQSITAAIAYLKEKGGVQVGEAAAFGKAVGTLAVERGEDAALMAYMLEADDESRADVSPVMEVAVAQLRAGKVDAALKAGRSVRQYMPRVRTLGSLGAILAAAGRADDALGLVLSIDDADERRAVLRWMVTPTFFGQENPEPRAREPALERAASLTFDAAMRNAAALPEEHGRDYAYALIARACAASGSLEHAWAAAGRIETPWSYFHALLAIAAAQAKAGEGEASLATFVQAGIAMRADGDADELVFKLARRQIEVRQFDAVTALLRDVAGGPRTALDTWLTQEEMAMALARLGRVPEAEALARVNDPGLRDTRRTLALSLAEGGFMREAVAMAAAAGDNDYGGTEFILSMLITERVEAGAIDDAKLALAAVKTSGGRAGGMLSIAAALSRAGRGDEAVAMVREGLSLIDIRDQYDGGGAVLIEAAEALPR